MVAARPEPLFDWFIPIDGDGVDRGAARMACAVDSYALCQWSL